MAQYGYTSRDYNTSYGAATGQGRTKPAGYYSDSYGTKPFVEQTEYKYSSPANKWGRPSSPVHDRDSQRAGEFFTKIQTEVSQQHTSSPSYGAMNWRQPPYSTGQHCNNGYTECSNPPVKNDSWNRPSESYTVGNGGFEDYHSRNDRTGGNRHGNEGWSTKSGSALSGPTNNIGAAVETLKEATAMFTAPVSAGHGYGDMDATRRYGNFKSTSRPNNGGYY